MTETKAPAHPAPAHAPVQPSWLTRLETTLETVAKEVGHDLLIIGEDVAQEGGQLLSQLVDVVAPIAMQAVVAQIPMVASGREKFGQAVTETYEQAASKGVPLVIQDAQLLVQAAFRKAVELFGSAAVGKNTTPSS